MKLMRESHSHNWRADDPAGLYLSDTAGAASAPTMVLAHRIGKISLEVPATIPVYLNSLTYMGKAFFGEARGTGTKWTGDYLKFALYRCDTEFGRPHVVILRTDGSGSHWYFVDQLAMVPAWQSFIDHLPEPALWDLCACLVHTYHEGAKHGRAYITGLFLNDRLKKRRRRGVVSMVIVDPKPQQTGISQQRG